MYKFNTGITLIFNILRYMHCLKYIEISNITEKLDIRINRLNIVIKSRLLKVIKLELEYKLIHTLSFILILSRK